MIQIDRHSDTPVHVQLEKRLRFMIANGDWRPGELLPPTRRLADQLDISFHTVRKSYGTLADEGLLESRPGKGYRVLDAEPTSKSERMERGADVMAGLLRELVSLGLDDDEIAYLFEEQRSLLDTDSEAYKIVVTGPFREWSQTVADQISVAVQRECLAVSELEIDQHADADYVLAPYAMTGRLMPVVQNADVIGIQYEIDDQSLSAVARMLDQETLGVVCRYSDAVGPISAEFRSRTRFSGQIMAVSVQEGVSHIPPLIRQSDILLYTSGAERRIRPFLDRIDRHAKLDIRVSPSTLDRIRSLIPG
ncbi:MAG: GntR family transcriptional regulator [Rhodothermales bacterium]|nr:GntR family transcriptional regulator [Rhodothermales bacterium]